MTKGGLQLGVGQIVRMMEGRNAGGILVWKPVGNVHFSSRHFPTASIKIDLR
jgi:hypothetical protein